VPFTVTHVTKMLPKQPPKFDLAKLEAMVEPFNIRIEKVRGNMRHEIPLPPSENGNPPGTGWSKEQVRDVEKWLVNEWSGGGQYAITILDSSQPPLMMEWPAFYSPVDFPERVPPLLAASSAVGAPIPTYQQQARPMAAQFNGGAMLPPASYYQAQQPQGGYFPPMPQPQSNGYAPQPWQHPTTVPMPAYNPAADADRRRLEQLLEQTQAQLAQAREQTAQREFERRAAEMKAESDRRFGELQQLIQQMGQNLTKQQPTHDPAIEQLRESNRMLQEQIRAAAEVAAQARREQEMRDLIRANQEEARRLIEAANARYELLVREAAKSGPDPTVMMFQEQMRMQVEAMKEMARSNQAQLDRVQQNIMRPQDLLQIVKDSSTGADAIAMQMNRAWQDMFQVSRQLTEQAAQMNQGGGNEVIGLVRDIGGGVQKMVEKYTGGKTKEAVAQFHTQAEMARAQADVIKSQNDRLAEMARTEATIKQGGVVVQRQDGSFVGATPPGAQPAIQSAPTPVNGNGAAHAAASSRPPWTTPKQPRTSAPVAQPVGGLNGAATPVVAIPVAAAVAAEPRKIKGRTDAEWFGVLLPKVIELRGGVDRLIESLSMVPPRMDPKNPVMPDGVVPEQTAMAVHQAALYVMEHQIPIPAMIDLLIQGMVPDFIDVLLPDAPQEYRDDVTKLLMSIGTEEEPNDEDEDEDEDDDEAVEAQT
jgi:hypothetical protein